MLLKKFAVLSTPPPAPGSCRKQEGSSHYHAHSISDHKRDTRVAVCCLHPLRIIPEFVVAPRQTEAREAGKEVGKRESAALLPCTRAVLLAFIAPSLLLCAPQTFRVFLHLRHGKGRWMTESRRRSSAAAGELPHAALQPEREAAPSAGNSAAESSQLPDSRVHFLDPGHPD